MTFPTIGIDIGGSGIKAALLAPDGAIATAKSDPYRSPDLLNLREAMRTALARLGPPAASAVHAGICAPGIRAPDGVTITACVNVPGLVGQSLAALVEESCGRGVALASITSDVHAAAVDIHANFRLPGRLLVIALGTGVGACVLDDGRQLLVSGGSSGHVGQVDVTLEDDAPVPVGPDGGRGSLEAYIGLPALEARYGRHLEHVIAAMHPASPPLRALARAIRICHAVYRPDTVVLAGGIGLLLEPKLEILRTLVHQQLTCLARPGSTLRTATSLFHAAVGAARLASVA